MYWILYINGALATSGASVTVLNVGDTIEIEFDNAHKKDYVVKGIFDTRFWESDFFIFITFIFPALQTYFSA